MAIERKWAIFLGLSIVIVAILFGAGLLAALGGFFVGLGLAEIVWR